MILGQDVIDAKGAVLMSRGTVLQSRNASILQRRGIQTVAVAEDGDSDPESCNDEDIALQLEKLKSTFAEVLDDPLMKTIYEQARQRAEQGLLRG